MTDITPKKILLAKDNGILMAEGAAIAVDKVGSPFSYAGACALLMKETGGGVNRYGHDPTQCDGFNDTVDKSNYRLYRWQRDNGGHRGPMGNQGVGPVQLTAKDLQAKADGLGGAWEPVVNMTVGFGVIKGFLEDGLSWHESFRRYNAGAGSSPPAGSAYADEAEALRLHFKEVLNP